MLEEENTPTENTPDEQEPDDQSLNDEGKLVEDDESVSRLKDRLNEAYGKQEDLHSKYLRTFADLDNLRKRSIRDREEAVQRTKKQIIEDLLPVIDAFNIGIEEALKTEPDGPLAKGFKMAIDQMDSVLSEYGLACINETGNEFDPQLHEAISYEPGDKEGIILKVVRNGYKINEHLLRPASVIVSKS